MTSLAQWLVFTTVLNLINRNSIKWAVCIGQTRDYASVAFLIKQTGGLRAWSF